MLQRASLLPCKLLCLGYIIAFCTRGFITFTPWAGPLVKVQVGHFAQHSHSFSDLSLQFFPCNTFSIRLGIWLQSCGHHKLVLHCAREKSNKENNACRLLDESALNKTGWCQILKNCYPFAETREPPVTYFPYFQVVTSLPCPNQVFWKCQKPSVLKVSSGSLPGVTVAACWIFQMKALVRGRGGYLSFIEVVKKFQQ